MLWCWVWFWRVRFFKFGLCILRIFVRGMSGSVYCIVWIGCVLVDVCEVIWIKIEYVVYLFEFYVVIEGFVVVVECYFYCFSI